DIEVDKALLTQVFQNIINNSIDALNEKDKNPEITIELLKKNNNAEIKIIDNGKGIKEEDLPLVFDPFFSTKPVGKGTGLGLAICRSIVEKHGGKITINSIYGKGTNVKIILPLEQFKNHE
ncbi:MAG: sensor histidine kinase, partial [Candidatus Helarchaeota archaeon]